jgi:hypothetical protein
MLEVGAAIFEKKDPARALAAQAIAEGVWRLRCE